jgi:hypothetical protein
MVNLSELQVRIKQLEAALRLTRPYIEMHTLSPNGTMATVLAKIDAALDNLCEDEGCPNAGTPHVCINRQENDDVYPGFRGNNEA